jgi:hypothetical protein
MDLVRLWKAQMILILNYITIVAHMGTTEKKHTLNILQLKL